MPRLLIVFLVWVLATVNGAVAQLKPTSHFTEEDGMAGNVVHDITTDKFGNLWIATEKGLSCYNGNSFRNFYKSDGLPSNAAWAVVFDSQNNLFVGCFKAGLAEMRNDSVVRVFHTHGYYPNTFRNLHYSRNYNLLLAGTNFGLFVLRDTSLVPIELPTDSNFRASVTSITEAGSRIFFTTHGWDGGGLYELKANPKKAGDFSSEKLSTNGRFCSVVMNDSLYISVDNTICSSSIKSIEMQKAYAPVDSQFLIWTMMPYRNKELWFGGWGEGRYRGCFGQLSLDGKPSSLPISVNAGSVWKIYEDTRSHTVWIASDNGLYCAYESPFTEYACGKNGSILNMAFKGDSLVVLTDRGLFLFQDGNLKQLLNGQKILNATQQHYNKVNIKFNKKFYGLFGTHRTNELSNLMEVNGRLYVQTTNGMVSVPDLKRYIAIGIGPVKVVDQNAAYTNVLYAPLCYHPSLDISRYLDYDTVRTASGAVQEIFKMVESKGVVYLASSYNGAYAVKNKTVYTLNDSNSLLDNNITDITKDDNGNIWCCSANGNLFELGFADSLYVRKALTSKNAGIAGTYSNWIIFSGEKLFLSTNLGLNVFRLGKLGGAQPRVDRFYNTYNGYSVISAAGPIRDRFGNVYVHTNDKIIKIGTDLGLQQEQDIVIQQASLNGRELTLEGIEGRLLPFSTRSIELEFCVVKYPSAKNISYQYRVNEGSWVAGSKVNLESPRAGHYNITLQAFDKENQTMVLKTVSFSVKLPFWLELWFLIPLVMSIAFIIYLFVKIRVRRLKLQHEEKTKLITSNSELLLRSLQLQMNPHFIFNSLQSIQGYVLERNVEEGLTFIGNLSSVIRSNFANAAEEYIPLSAEIEFLKRYVEIEQVRFQNSFEVEFAMGVDDWNVVLPPMLIQPLVENAIKHGVRNSAGKGLIRIALSKKDSLLVVEVEDNGVGREHVKNLKKSDGNGKGLGIIEQRLQLLNARMHTSDHSIQFVDLYEKGLPTGTRVVVHLSYLLQEG